ncbi:hypothetical protein F0919_14070 [Taibaiella lutea]|uniref:Uncharacterized protein n=1 Tax=Taibaiella lutea TaxID=2608001 RepID=A0A5M6CKK3_9BACT|nr:hypothetical protein [Taibaiella lutea]KAA5533659.1 hypothetical protein F0919_14070 [Taibaiella lutea]
MPISNLNNDHFEIEDREQINQAWSTIMTILTSKTRNLTPKERLKYGSVSEENKLVVQKVLEYHENQPHLSSPDVDFWELQADWSDRMFLAGFMSKMVEATNICNNVRITHDYDAFQNSRVDYKHCKYKMETEPGAGFEAKYKDLLYFFKSYVEPAGDDTEAGNVTAGQ